MKEHGIPFSTELIPKVMDGSKTVTRRVIVPQPILVNDRTWTWPGDGNDSKASWGDSYPAFGMKRFCPYGGPGDLLWLKEKLVKIILPAGDWITGYADGSWVPKPNWAKDKPLLWRWNKDVLSPRFMPKYAARTWLEVVSVRVERVQEITVRDAIAEGLRVEDNWASHVGGAQQVIMDFAALWDRIDAKRGYPWSSNPWVWRIEFKLQEKRP